MNAHLALPLVALLALPADAPRFAPKAGTTVRRAIAMVGTRDLVRHTRQVDGESRDEEASESVLMGWKTVVSDRVLACEAGRVTKFERTFDTLDRRRTSKGRDPGKDEREATIVETCDLLEKTVAFAWQADAKSWKRTIDGEEAPDLTGALDVDMDYTAFLPAEGAAEGATWKVDFADVKTALLRPGGDVPCHGKDPVKPMDKRMRDAAWDAIAGELELSWKAVEEEGKHLARISFRGEQHFDASVKRAADETGPDGLRVEDAEKVEGEIVWDLDAQHVRSLRYTSKGPMTFTFSGSGRGPDGVEHAMSVRRTYDCVYQFEGIFRVD